MIYESPSNWATRKIILEPKLFVNKHAQSAAGQANQFGLQSLPKEREREEKEQSKFCGSQLLASREFCSKFVSRAKATMQNRAKK